MKKRAWLVCGVLGCALVLLSAVVPRASAQLVVPDEHQGAFARSVPRLRFDAGRRVRGALHVRRGAEAGAMVLRGRAGGPIASSQLGLPAQCGGAFPERAQHVLVLPSDLASLELEVRARGGGATLAVVAPDGSVWCDGGTARLRGAFSAGTYQVLVGSLSGRPMPYALTLVQQAAPSTPVVVAPALDARRIPGTYDGMHPHWRDLVNVYADGTYARGNGDGGRWHVEGDVLVLAWARWAPERLALQRDGTFVAPSNGFTLAPRDPAIGPPPPVAAIDRSVVVGTWQGAHPHWSDAVVIAADGTYQRGNGDPGRWRIEGRTLVLEWAHWGPERLELQPDGSFRRAADGFALRRVRYGSPPVDVTPPPRPAVPECRQTVIELGHPPASMMFCDGVEPRCADALLRAGHDPSALVFCGDAEPRCAEQLLRAGRSPAELVHCPR